MSNSYIQVSDIVAVVSLIVSISATSFSAWQAWRYRACPRMVVTTVLDETKKKLLPLVLENETHPQTFCFLENIGDADVLEISVRGYDCRAIMVYFTETQQFPISYANQRMLDSGNVVIVLYHGNGLNEPLPNSACINIHYLLKPARLHRCGMSSYAVSEFKKPEFIPTKKALAQRRKYLQALSNLMHSKYHSMSAQEMEYSPQRDNTRDWYMLYMSDPLKNLRQRRLE